MALNMSVRGALLRYTTASVVMASVQLAGYWFHSAGTYQGASNNPLREFPGDVDFFFVLTFAPTVVCLKYLLYDMAVRGLTGQHRTAVTHFLFYAGYASAMALDAALLFAASKPVADAGFAMLAVIFQSPLVLAAFAAVVAVIVVASTRPRPASPPGTPGQQ